MAQTFARARPGIAHHHHHYTITSTSSSSTTTTTTAQLTLAIHKTDIIFLQSCCDTNDMGCPVCCANRTPHQHHQHPHHKQAGWWCRRERQHPQTRELAPPPLLATVLYYAVFPPVIPAASLGLAHSSLPRRTLQLQPHLHYASLASLPSHAPLCQESNEG